jgi:hypothetical protein
MAPEENSTTRGDPFRLLGFPRRPWLDPEDVRARFRELSETHHPDRAMAAPAEDAGERKDADSAALSAAAQQLSSTPRRLRLILETEPEAPSRRTGTVPEGVIELFMSIGQTTKTADALIAKLQKTDTQLGRAVLLKEIMRTRADLEKLLENVEEQLEILETDLRRVDALWQEHPEDALTRLPSLYQRSSYLTKWREQLRERLARLIF